MSSPTKTTAAAPAPVRLPPYEEHVLDNGMRLLVAPRRALPLATVQLFVETGGGDDPAGKAGLASLALSLMKRGTRRRSADELNGAIEFVGGHLDAAAGPDASSISASLTAENLPLAMELVADVALNPAFPKREFDTQKRRVLAELAQELDDPGAVGDRAMLRTVLPAGHPYALPTAGTPAGVASVEHADVVEFHARRFVPSRATLIVVGDVEPGEVRRLAEDRFGRWRTPAPEGLLHAEPHALHRNRILVVHKAESTQVQIRVVQLSFAGKTDPAYFPATVANTAFGGGFTSRLVDEIRVNRGLSYNATSRFLQLRHAGFFTFKSFTKNESVAELLAVLFGEAERARREGFRDDEIARARSYLAGLYPLRLETNEQVAGALAELLLYRLPGDWVSTYRERLAAVTTAEANAAAARWFFAEPYGLVLVGDQEAIKAGLKGAAIEGELRVVEIEQLE